MGIGHRALGIGNKKKENHQFPLPQTRPLPIAHCPLP
jgi:hypothetical protein